MRKILVVTSIVALAFSGAAFADHYSDFYVLAAAGHTNGLNGTNWMSDIAIQNFQAAPITVELVLVETGEANPDNVFPVITPAVNGSVVVPPNGSVLLKDVLNGYRGGMNVLGSILIGSDRPFAVTSRAYSMNPAGDTIGQTVPPARNFLENTIGITDPATAVAYIPGLINNARFRTNLGLVAANASGSGEPLNLRVIVRNAAGVQTGTRDLSLPPGAVIHTHFNVRNLTGIQNFDIGSAEVRVLSGSGAVVPYASVIDNNTADAVTVMGEFPMNRSRTGLGFTESAFRVMFNRMRVRQ